MWIYSSIQDMPADMANNKNQDMKESSTAVRTNNSNLWLCAFKLKIKDFSGFLHVK